MESVRRYIVIAAALEAEHTTTLHFIPERGSVPSFMPGQFVNAYLPEISVEGKSYSIASSPEEPHFELTVRAMGRFSGRLCALRPGDSLLLSEPHGFFTPENKTTPRIFLAAGIGSAPFMSMLRSDEDPPLTHMLYSNRTSTSAPFLRQITEYSLTGRISLKRFFTREQNAAPGAIHGRLNEPHLREAAHIYPNAHWYLCGGIPFVRDMRVMLRTLGIREERIFTESFF